MGRAKQTRVYSISGVNLGLTEDQSSRQRKYFISMMVRTGCFISAVILNGALRWIAIAGAVLLPYIAVVIANAGRESGPRENVTFTPNELH